MGRITNDLFDVTGGRITLDGEDIKHFTLKSLRSNIGIVQQDVYLFSGTVLENILYGRKDGYDTYVTQAFYHLQFGPHTGADRRGNCGRRDPSGTVGAKRTLL